MGTNVRDRERARWLWASATLCFGLLVGYALGSLGNRVAAPIALPAGSLVDIAVTLVAIAAASMVYGVVSDARSAERARRLQVELDRIYAGEPELFESIRTRAANVLMADRGRERSCPLSSRAASPAHYLWFRAPRATRRRVGQATGH